MLLDSNILIYGASSGSPGLDAILDRTDLAVASITRIETLGFHRLQAIHRHWLEVTLGRMRTLPLDNSVVARAVALRQERRMGLGDAVIAATALVHGLRLVTRNVADFEHIEGLQLLDPFEDA